VRLAQGGADEDVVMAKDAEPDGRGADRSGPAST
jgi:hypothetical protein